MADGDLKVLEALAEYTGDDPDLQKAFRKQISEMLEKEEKSEIKSDTNSVLSHGFNETIDPNNDDLVS